MAKTEFVLEFEKPLRALEQKLEELENISREHDLDVSGEIADIVRKIDEEETRVYSNLTAWQKIQLARHPRRPYAPEYIREIFSDFQELHGDRCYGDDQALTGGLAFFEGGSVLVISQQKGRDTKENIRRNFGMPNPEGYRKALRLMKLAEKFGLPIIAFIDTPGAFPGLGSEERHVAEAIAVNLREMSTLRVPIISVILGEGGSGGALGIGVANRVLPMENAYYSVISPEGCAAILWKDRSHAPQAADALKIGAGDLLRHGIADEVIKEPFGGAHRNPVDAFELVREAIARHLADLRKRSPEEVREERYQKFRAIGVFEETRATAGATRKVKAKPKAKRSSATAKSASGAPPARKKTPAKQPKVKGKPKADPKPRTKRKAGGNEPAAPPPKNRAPAAAATSAKKQPRKPAAQAREQTRGSPEDPSIGGGAPVPA